MKRSKTARRVLVLVAAFGLAFALPAQAASPASGSISKAKRSLKWSGSFNLSFPALNDTDAVLDFNCKGETADACDHYSLKVNLGEGAIIEVKVISDSPCSTDCNSTVGAPVDGNDIDVYVYASNGAAVGAGTSPAGVERVRFKHKARNRNKAYDIGVLPWAVVPGTTYKGTVTAITLGR